MPTSLILATAPPPAPPAAGAGQVVTIAVPVVLILVIIYLCKHKRHKITTAILGFATGALLGGTTLGTAITKGVVDIITGLVSALTGIST